jgi:hypothetical protein
MNQAEWPELACRRARSANDDSAEDFALLEPFVRARGPR